MVDLSQFFPNLNRGRHVMLSGAGIIVCLFSHRTPGPVLLAVLPGFSAVTQSIYLCCVLLFYTFHTMHAKHYKVDQSAMIV